MSYRNKQSLLPEARAKASGGGRADSEDAHDDNKDGKHHDDVTKVQPRHVGLTQQLDNPEVQRAVCAQHYTENHHPDTQNLQHTKTSFKVYHYSPFYQYPR